LIMSYQKINILVYLNLPIFDLATLQTNISIKNRSVT